MNSSLGELGELDGHDGQRFRPLRKPPHHVTTQEVAMATYTIHATKVIRLTAAIQAESLEQAEQYTDELLVDDFTETGTHFSIDDVSIEKGT
jgi:hypothetical protein